jgi:hypothetical protein
MLRFLVRHGAVRLIGRRALPALIVWDVAVLANRARQIPLVDRGLRRSAWAARRGAGSVVRGAARRAGSRNQDERRDPADP